MFICNIFQHTVTTITMDNIVAKTALEHIYNYLRYHFTTVTLIHVVATMTLDITAAFDIIVCNYSLPWLPHRGH
jgi:protein-L-isoaspartate O-methyltransferase